MVSSDKCNDKTKRYGRNMVNFLKVVIVEHIFSVGLIISNVNQRRFVVFEFYLLSLALNI